MPQNKRPNRGQFKKGQRGGPGRKKGEPNKVSRDIKLMAREYGPEALDKIVGFMRGRSKPMAFAACRELLDRGYGKAPQHVQGELGTTINILLAQWAQPVTVAPGDDAKLINGGGNGAGHPAAE